jgi:membrane fusion protein, multidrug efflux system
MKTEDGDQQSQPAPAPSGAGQAPGDQKSAPTNKRGRGRAFTIFFLVLLTAALVGLYVWLQSRQFETTDDAEVDTHLSVISARVDGSVVRVYVDENQIVKLGDPLVDLDPRDYQVSVDQARAQLAQARSMVTAQRPNVPIAQVESTANISGAEADVTNAEAAVAAAERDREVAAAKLTEAEANSARAQADLARYKILIANEEVSKQEYDQIAATAAAQSANVAAARASVESASRLVDQRRAQLAQVGTRLAQYRQTATQTVAIRQATVEGGQANELGAHTQVEQAELKLSYTKIVAPVGGIVLKRSAEVGMHVAAGQQLLTIAQIGDVYVTANFKETQLRNIKPGQSANIHVDALKQDFEGYVENLGGSTGAMSSVLPPENATGNFVKVVQRIPVRLRFKPNQNGLDRLRPGMSVEPKVRIEG